tara:strand:- start:151292 stop:152140 length:849 start_codon:yes stop_codon:yes gene_type:complete
MESIKELIANAYQEDIPHGDVTTDNLEIRSRIGSAHLIAKEDLVLSGTSVFEQCLLHIDPDVKIKWYFQDGETALTQQTIALIQGDLVKLLTAERVALNFLGRLTGVSTATKLFVKALGKSSTQILDTRKTTPLLRSLEKQAVLHGGGQNHRMNLSDAAMLKENHLHLFGGDIIQAVKRIRKNSPETRITVETTNLDEVRSAVESECDQILLDNMDITEMAVAIEMIPDTIKTEASGNITLDRIPKVAELGLDYISVGAITHSSDCADLSLLFHWEKQIESP